MQRQYCFQSSEDGVSPIIGTVIILAIMVSITGAMLAWGIPQIQQSEAYAIYTSSQNNFLNFDADIDRVLLQGTGASRSSTVSFSSGTFVLRENLDEIRYYYTSVSWSDPKLVGVKKGSTSFAIADTFASSVVSDYRVKLTYSNGTTWNGTTTSAVISGFPELDYGTKAIYTSTDNETQIGGFFIYGTDSLSYKFASVSGMYKMRMFNGGITAKEPGISFYMNSRPLIRSIDNASEITSFSLYQTDYNLSDSSRSLTAGNFNFDIRNQGGIDNSLNIYSLRMGFTGDSSSALRTYFQSSWDFAPKNYYFSSKESIAASIMGTEEDISYSQDNPFDFRILERTLHVKFSIR